MGRSSPRGATPSPPPLSARLSVTSRRSSAMSPLTSSRRCPPLLPPPPSRSPMSFPTARSSPSATRGSGTPRPSSSLPSSEWRLAESTRPPTTPADVDLQAGVRRVRPRHRPPQVLLSYSSLLSHTFSYYLFKNQVLSSDLLTILFRSINAN